jgi:hypothetical protein
VYQLQAMYKLGSPVANPVITTQQVVYPAPARDEADTDEEGYYYPPVMETTVTEDIITRGPVEQNDTLTFFESKKKKRSKQAQASPAPLAPQAPKKADDPKLKKKPDQNKKQDAPGNDPHIKNTP